MLAETCCASFKEKLIGVPSFYLLRSQKAILFITCEIWSENIDRRFFFFGASLPDQSAIPCLFSEGIK